MCRVRCSCVYGCYCGDIPRSLLVSATKRTLKHACLLVLGFDLGRIHGSVHTRAFNHLLGTQKSGSLSIDVSDWHEYEIVWNADQIDFVLDGLKYFEFTRAADATFVEWPFDRDFHMILNVAVGGTWGGLQGVDSAAFEGGGQIMEVDWVRVYRDS